MGGEKERHGGEKEGESSDQPAKPKGVEERKGTHKTNNVLGATGTPKK